MSNAIESTKPQETVAKRTEVRIDGIHLHVTREGFLAPFRMRVPFRLVNGVLLQGGWCYIMLNGMDSVCVFNADFDELCRVIDCQHGTVIAEHATDPE